MRCGALIFPPVQQVQKAPRHHLRALYHLVNSDIFIRLMRKVQNARPIGNTVFQPPDTVNVFLVISPWRNNIICLFPHDITDRASNRLHHRRALSVIVGKTR